MFWNEQPEVPPHLTTVYEGFWACSTMRSVGMSTGSIPFDKLVWYIEEFLGADSYDDMDRYIRLMRRMDSAYAKATAPKKKESA